MARYVVKLETISHMVVDARDEDHAMRRAVAVAKNGRENTEIYAVKATRE